MDVQAPHAARGGRDPATSGASRREPAPSRVASLDAVRGVAALLVVFSHCYATLPDALQRELDWHSGPGQILVSGRPAVILFFVLSGFVLSLSLAGDASATYRTFAVRRFFRIYPPFAAAVLASAALYRLIGPAPIPGLSEWFNCELWSHEPAIPLVMAHLAMVGRPADATLNNPMWSLVVEMRLSLLFPLVFRLLWPEKRRAWVAAVASAIIAELIARETSIGREPYYNSSLREAVLLTLYFVPFFVFGLLVAQARGPLRRWAGRMGGPGRGSLWVAAWALLETGRDVPSGVGAALVVVLSLASPLAERILSAPPLQWLGRVSYSLYLTHVLVLGALVHLLHGVVPLGWLLLGVVLASLPVAQAAYTLVERPSSALGRRLAAGRNGNRRD